MHHAPQALLPTCTYELARVQPTSFRTELFRSSCAHLFPQRPVHKSTTIPHAASQSLVSTAKATTHRGDEFLHDSVEVFTLTHQHLTRHEVCQIVSPVHRSLFPDVVDCTCNIVSVSAVKCGWDGPIATHWAIWNPPASSKGSCPNGVVFFISAQESMVNPFS